MVLKEPDQFGADPNCMYTVLDVMLAKFDENSRDFIGTMPYFKEIANTYLHHLTYDKLLDLAKRLLKTPVVRGGNIKNATGTSKLPEVQTILRKFAHLASAITFMIKNGIPLENHAIKVVAYLRELHKKEQNGHSSKPNRQ